MHPRMTFNEHSVCFIYLYEVHNKQYQKFVGQIEVRARGEQCCGMLTVPCKTKGHWKGSCVTHEQRCSSVARTQIGICIYVSAVMNLLWFVRIVNKCAWKKCVFYCFTLFVSSHLGYWKIRSKLFFALQLSCKPASSL